MRIGEPESITPETLAKVIIRFLKENGLYMKYYNFFAKSYDFNRYVYTKKGLAGYIRNRLKDNEDLLDFEFLGIYLDGFTIKQAIFPRYIVYAITNFRTTKDVKFFYDYFMDYLEELGYLNGRIINWHE